MGTHSVQTSGLQRCRLSVDLRSECQVKQWERSLERAGFTGGAAADHLLRDEKPRVQCPSIPRVGESKQPPNSILWGILKRAPHYVEGPVLLDGLGWPSADGLEKRSVLIAQLGVAAVAMVMSVHESGCAIATKLFDLQLQWDNRLPFTMNAGLVAIGKKAYDRSAWGKEFPECVSQEHLLHKFTTSSLTKRASWFTPIISKLTEEGSPRRMTAPVRNRTRNRSSGNGDRSDRGPRKTQERVDDKRMFKMNANNGHT